MRIIYDLLLVTWNLAVLAGLVLLLLSDLGWVTKLLALLFVPLAVMTGISAWREGRKRHSPRE